MDLLPSHRAREFSDIVNLLAMPLSLDALRARLMLPLARLLDADQVASFVWDGAHGRFARGVGCGILTRNLQAYEDAFQFEDPIARALHPLREPTLVSQVIPQRELVHLPFYNRFLAGAGLYWGVNLFAHDGSRDVGDLRIWRHGDKPNFGTREMALLKLIYPALVTAFSRADTGSEGGADLPAAAAPNPLRDAGLSPREIEVTRLAARGATDKEIARELGVAFTTVRTHLSAALRKLNCRNRRELMLSQATASPARALAS